MINLNLGLQDRLKMITGRLLPVGSWRDSRADQGQRHEHDVAVTHKLYLGDALRGLHSGEVPHNREATLWGPNSEGEGRKHFLGEWDQDA